FTKYRYAVFLVSIVLSLSYGSEAGDLDEDRKPQLENATVLSNYHRECYLYQRPVDCAEIYRLGFQKSGVYDIYPKSRILGTSSVKVYCDMVTDGGGWTVRPILFIWAVMTKSRFTRSSHIQLFKKFFPIGNDVIHVLTNQRKYAVRFDLGTDRETAYAHYNSFWIDNEEYKYKLHISGFSGTAGDSMTYHNGMSFSTKDRDNDRDVKNCAEWWKGGWWYNSCHSANLNGLYLKGTHNQYRYDMITWKTWKGYTVSLSNVEMKIRPIDF
ncbi:techylectin-5A, partial [Parasteatoda tepidariorum]|uniref:techylectin-5A n=1 Tax=Parasteatoda tepidariorum TaxID=114398 RepID=UPI0039BD2EE9